MGTRIWIFCWMFVVAGCDNVKFSAPGRTANPQAVDAKPSDAATPKSYNLISIANFPFENPAADVKIQKPLFADLESLLEKLRTKGHTLNFVNSKEWEWGQIFGRGIVSEYPDLAARICPANQSKVLSTFVFRFNNGNGNYADLTVVDEVQICNRNVKNDKQNPLLHLVQDPTFMTRLAEKGLMDRIDPNLPTVLALFLDGRKTDNATQVYDLNWLAQIILDLQQQGSGKLKTVLIHDSNSSKCELLTGTRFGATYKLLSQNVEHAGSFIEKTKGSSIDICDPAWADKLADVLTSL